MEEFIMPTGSRLPSPPDSPVNLPNFSSIVPRVRLLSVRSVIQASCCIWEILLCRLTRWIRVAIQMVTLDDLFWFHCTSVNQGDGRQENRRNRFQAERINNSAAVLQPCCAGSWTLSTAIQLFQWPLLHSHQKLPKNQEHTHKKENK